MQLETSPTMNEENACKVATADYTYTDKKRFRKGLWFITCCYGCAISLLATQIEASYSQFLQADVPIQERKDIGLNAAFQTVFPIESYSGNAKLEYVHYELGEPAFDVKECKLRGLTYAAPLRVNVRLIIYDKDSTDSKAVKNIH